MRTDDLTSGLFGGPRVYTIDELADRAGVSVDGLGVTYQVPLALALGQSMARMADWRASLLRDIAASSTVPGSEEMRNEVAEVALALLPNWERLQRHVWRRHMLLALEHVMSDEETPPNEDPLVVGFADIVGFSSISSGLTPERMTKFVEEFTESCSFIVVGGGGWQAG